MAGFYFIICSYSENLAEVEAEASRGLCPTSVRQVVGSISTKRTNIEYVRSGNEAKRGVKFHHSILML